jgi:energy-coupling factor transporter ATP-binding protein EcfA2
MRNPFEFGRELSADELVDRTAELATITAAIRSAAKLWLIGPRRYGKTSLLKSAAEIAEASGRTIVLRYDAEAFPTLEQLAARILADTASRLTGTFEKSREATKRFFANVRPEATIEPDGTLSIRLAGAKDRGTGVPLLTDVLKGVDRAAAMTGKSVVVIIDEFQRIVAGDASAKQQFRAAVQTHKHVGYVFAGSATRVLTDMTTNPKEAFYRLGSHLFLGPIPRTDFAAFLERSFGRSHIAVRAGAIDAILDAAENVPYNVQLLAHGCWEACRANVNSSTGRGAAALTPALVRATHDASARQNDPLYTQLWNDLTSTQQRALLAVLREHGTKLTSTDVARRYAMPVTTMQKALIALEKRGITREEGAEGVVRLRLEDPVFGNWVDLTIPK